MLIKRSLSTDQQGMYDITDEVERVLRESQVSRGVCYVYCPHTTAGITINENADADVQHDLLLGFSKAFPDRAEFRHFEGNSAAHLKASCIGPSVTVLIEAGELILGTWQGIYFCEFDGPRQRTFFVKISSD